MKRTGRSVHLYSRACGWNFVRAIYEDEDGTRYARINGSYFELERLLDESDQYTIDDSEVMRRAAGRA